MPGGLFDGALPIGLVMLLGTVVTVVTARLGRRRAALDFPQLAATLGLTYAPPRYRDMIGSLSGVVRGRPVRIDPDEQKMIAVRFVAAPLVDLRSYEHGRGAPHGMVPVHTGHRDFDRFFRTRFASPEIAARLTQMQEPDALLRAFRGGLRRKVQSLSVTAEGVVCRLDFGTPAYIPAGALQALLPACLALAEVVESDDPHAAASAPLESEADSRP